MLCKSCKHNRGDHCCFEPVWVQVDRERHYCTGRYQEASGASDLAATYYTHVCEYISRWGGLTVCQPRRAFAEKGLTMVNDVIELMGGWGAFERYPESAHHKRRDEFLRIFRELQAERLAGVE